MSAINTTHDDPALGGEAIERDTRKLLGARPRPALDAAGAAPAATAPACRARWRPTACGGVCPQAQALS